MISAKSGDPGFLQRAGIWDFCEVLGSGIPAKGLGSGICAKGWNLGFLRRARPLDSAKVGNRGFLQKPRIKAWDLGSLCKGAGIRENLPLLQLPLMRSDHPGRSLAKGSGPMVKC